MSKTPIRDIRVLCMYLDGNLTSCWDGVIIAPLPKIQH